MKRAYIVVGELEDGRADDYYAICHSMKRADELCFQAENECKDTVRYYTWYPVIEEEDDE